jgi:hypothetical protein
MHHTQYCLVLFCPGLDIADKSPRNSTLSTFLNIELSVLILIHQLKAKAKAKVRLQAF